MVERAPSIYAQGYVSVSGSQAAMYREPAPERVEDCRLSPLQSLHLRRSLLPGNSVRRQLHILQKRSEKLHVVEELLQRARRRPRSLAESGSILGRIAGVVGVEVEAAESTSRLPEYGPEGTINGFD